MPSVFLFCLPFTKIYAIFVQIIIVRFVKLHAKVHAKLRFALALTRKALLCTKKQRTCTSLTFAFIYVLLFLVRETQ